MLQKWRPNVLLTGPEESTAAAVNALMPCLLAPVVTWQTESPLALPPAIPVGTLLLRNIAWLTLTEQECLLEWIQRSSGATQVVATSSVVLFPLVERGTFSAQLYYRLNVIYFELGR
jgi:transcriptional regulator of acetoin/glycerol metabolism